MQVARKIAPCDRALIHVCLAYLFLHSGQVLSFDQRDGEKDDGKKDGYAICAIYHRLFHHLFGQN